tara:strand:+ start:403 stop:705 length:303 start_codon:yes stop_codon:yes gene_type:complete
MIKNEESLLQKTILLKRRTSSTIPFGYELSEKDNEYLQPVEEQLEALEAVEEMVVKEQISLRDGCYWLENHTGRKISPAGLKKIIDKKYGKREERLGSIS